MSPPSKILKNSTKPFDDNLCDHCHGLEARMMGARHGAHLSPNPRRPRRAIRWRNLHRLYSTRPLSPRTSGSGSRMAYANPTKPNDHPSAR